jgi:hypothetical protein
VTSLRARAARRDDGAFGDATGHAGVSRRYRGGRTARCRSIGSGRRRCGGRRAT